MSTFTAPASPRPTLSFAVLSETASQPGHSTAPLAPASPIGKWFGAVFLWLAIRFLGWGRALRGAHQPHQILVEPGDQIVVRALGRADGPVLAHVRTRGVPVIRRVLARLHAMLLMVSPLEEWGERQELAAHEEFVEREERERAKCLRKYGEAGLAPAGDPSRDVLDYAINECVGLVRYAEMINARVRQLYDVRADDYPVQGVVGATFFATTHLAGVARDCGVALLAIRNHLLAGGHSLGAAESADATPGAEEPTSPAEFTAEVRVSFTDERMTSPQRARATMRALARELNAAARNVRVDA